ncbi:serine/threonine-protein kinase [Myxococcus sp. RHSTA-1-4]|uniref:serine/threonine protein kinase n=1 Tax=Myxococcus sp. RHSTA-1-4 TaxID=2874601 RepID=UPI001CBFBA0F|nr:serine/threonine-protein kinase [Myxococcus sp. RHSTA-1-4]MBZ4423283.1 protein kinase [Myxococcus sp. RHSTA-1-4]
MRMESDEFPALPALLSPRNLPPGTLVGRWRVERQVGSGGNGTVYEVCRRPGGPCHALKLAHVPDDPRFAREAETLRLLQHPGVVRLKDEGLWDNGPKRYPYLVLEYVRGDTLYDWALGRNPTAREVAGLLEQTTRALAAAHREGVLHRDFKGDNVRVDGAGRLVVLDWGAGWHEDASPLTSTARLPPGTSPYRSPQALLWCIQALREPRAAGHYVYTVADELYAVGVTFFRLLAELYPLARLNEEPGAVTEEAEPSTVRDLNPRVPEPLALWVHWLMEFTPEARPKSAEALAREVRRALAEAGPEWDVPLFEWYTGPAPDTRTTSEGTASGPVAPEQEEALRLARLRQRARAQQHRDARRVRRRARERLVTLPEPGTGAHSRWSTGPRAWRLALVMGALLLAAGTAGAVAYRTRSSPFTEEAPTGQQLARWEAPADTSTPATARAPLFFAAPPWPGEDTMPTTTESPSQCPTRLRRYLLAASAAGLTACAATQVIPEPARCPSEALETMRLLRLKAGDGGFTELDILQPDISSQLNYRIVVNDGPITSRLVEQPLGRLPVGTLIYGRLWTGGEQVLGRYTRVKTPDGSEYPVCFVLSDLDGLPKSRSSSPGYTRVVPRSHVMVVDRFP